MPPERQIQSNIYLWISDSASDEAVCLSHNRPRHNVLAESTMSSVVFSHPLTTQISLIWIILNVISGDFMSLRLAWRRFHPFLFLFSASAISNETELSTLICVILSSHLRNFHMVDKKKEKKCSLIFIRSVCVCPWNRIVRLTALWMKLVDGNCVIRIVSHQYWCKLESFNLESKKVLFLSTTSGDSKKSFASKLST